MLSIYGMSYLIYLIINGTQIGANFTGKVVNCVLKPIIIIGKILSKKSPRKSLQTNYFVIFLFADVFEKITPNLVKP